MVKGYKTLSIKEEIFNKIEIKYNKLAPKESITSWVSDYLLMNIEKDEFLKEYAPFLEKIGINDNRLTIRDSKTNKLTDVFLKNKKLFCSLDESDDCLHIHYVLALPELAKLKA